MEILWHVMTDIKHSPAQCKRQLLATYKSQWEKHNRAERERNNRGNRITAKQEKTGSTEWVRPEHTKLFSSSSFVSMCRARKGWACWEKTHRQQGKTLNALTVLLTFSPQEKPASCLSFPQHLLHLITHGVIINRIQRRRKEENCCKLPCIITDQREWQTAQTLANLAGWREHFCLSKTFHMPVTYPRVTQSHKSTRGRRESKTSPLCFLCAVMQLAKTARWLFWKSCVHTSINICVYHYKPRENKVAPCRDFFFFFFGFTLLNTPLIESEHEWCECQTSSGFL